jgi:hypothetical protein
MENGSKPTNKTQPAARAAIETEEEWGVEEAQKEKR